VKSTEGAQLRDEATNVAFDGQEEHARLPKVYELAGQAVHESGSPLDNQEPSADRAIEAEPPAKPEKHDNK
jgi:hypothetical protein